MISLNDFQLEPQEIAEQELEAIERVIKSGWYILGSEVAGFEQRWAGYCESKYAIGVANGMDAIEIGLRALGVGIGDEVITTPMTAFATVLGIIRAGATPVLADIDSTTALLDIESVKQSISSRTKAVLLVHLYGQIKYMDLWTKFCREKNIYLLEDCAQSHGAIWNHRQAGNFGEWGAYSFYPTKNLGAIGDAGALVTNSVEVAKQSQILRNYGQSQRYYHPQLGLNSRLDELQAAILSVRLNWLDRFTVRRQQIAKMYLEAIDNSSIVMLAPPNERENHVYHLFVLLSENRDALAVHLRERGIGTLIHYPVPVHHQTALQKMDIEAKELTQAEYHSKHCLSIPCHPQMSDEDVEKVIEAINDYE
jgi:dTDP-4-amino-4,6-dideoxygalactose transaminase